MLHYLKRKSQIQSMGQTQICGIPVGHCVYPTHRFSKYIILFVSNLTITYHGPRETLAFQGIAGHCH